MYSDQPTMPSSVVIFTKELTRQPASQCRSSILTIFIVIPHLGGKALTKSGVPAEAGTHRSASETAEKWVPAFAGTPVWVGGLCNEIILGRRCRRVPVRDR